MSDLRAQVDKALSQTLLQSDKKAVFKLPDNQREAIVEAVMKVIEERAK
jgi:hypothetical protein